ncbi:hypothetical protein FPV67DRAFT_1560909 [Lyophyllum atratum]|nr:hypothetical protein FPV67DRAFT_1560909 [Lyophyllum atratum]
MPSPDRSQSRGRDVYQSSGRGGAGNIRQTSASRDARPSDGPDDFSIVRGREPLPASLKQTFSTGRGGAGNIRSPSRDPTTPNIAEEDTEFIRAHIAAAHDGPHSSGRGGAGNISRSRSRGPALYTQTPPTSGTPIRSTGRGGVGNMIDEAAVEGEDEIVVLRLREEEGAVHSTGRGGAANMTHSPAPGIERLPSPPRLGEYESTGRGGAGNIVKDRSRSGTRT